MATGDPRVLVEHTQWGYWANVWIVGRNNRRGSAFGDSPDQAVLRAWDEMTEYRIGRNPYQSIRKTDGR